MSAASTMAAATSTRTGWVCLALAIIFNNGANFLLKALSDEVGASIGLFFSLDFIIAAGCYGVGFLAYVKALAGLPLSLAYPVLVGGSLLAVAIAGAIGFGGAVSGLQIFGMALIFIGVTLISVPAPSTLSGRSAGRS